MWIFHDNMNQFSRRRGFKYIVGHLPVLATSGQTSREVGFSDDILEKQAAWQISSLAARAGDLVERRMVMIRTIC